MDAGTVGPAAATAGGPAPDQLLDLVWRRHRQWSVAADAARRRLNRWRLWNLVLLVVGAVTGALAAQTGLAARTATWSAVVAAVSLGLAGFLQAHLLTTGQTARWARARAASEALKAETHRYLLRVAPYAGADRAQVLQAQLDLVGARAAALLVDAQNVPVDDRPLPAVRTVEEYVTARARGQAAWHRDRSRRHARRAGRLRAWRLRAWQLAATGLMAWSGAGRASGGGCVVVASPGNESRRDVDPHHGIAVSIPAAADGEVSVGALGELRRPPGGPLLQHLPQVSGPRVQVLSARPGGGLPPSAARARRRPTRPGWPRCGGEELAASDVPLSARATVAGLLATATTAGPAGDVDPAERGLGFSGPLTRRGVHVVAAF